MFWRPRPGGYQVRVYVHLQDGRRREVSVTCKTLAKAEAALQVKLQRLGVSSAPRLQDAPALFDLDEEPHA